MSTTQDYIEYRGYTINKFKTTREFRINGKWESVETILYSSRDAYTSQSLDAVKSHIDFLLSKSEEPKPKRK